MNRYLTLTEATDRVPVSTVTIRRAIRAGELPAYKPAGRLLIRPEDLDAWVQAGRVTTDPMPQPKRNPVSFIEQVRHDRQEAA